MIDEDEELLPDQESDEGEPEDRDALLQQLQNLSHQLGPASSLFQAGRGWLDGTVEAEEVRKQAAELEGQLQEMKDDPLVSSQFDRLDDALAENLTDQVIYALLGLGAQLKPEGNY